MGQMRFFSPRHDRILPQAVESAYLVGMEGIPWPGKVSVVDCRPGAELVIERSIAESGNLFLPWDVPGVGEVLIGTACLMERPEPYLLPLELARGILNRVRNQAAEWEQGGMPIAGEVRQSIDGASAMFIDAVGALPDLERVANLSEQVIQLAYQASRQLAFLFSRFMQSTYPLTAAPAKPLFGAAVETGDGQAILNAGLARLANAAALRFRWRDIEPSAGKLTWDHVEAQLAWCERHGMRVVGGPLLELDARQLPDWLYLWEDDFDQVRSFVTRFTETVVSRYKGRVAVWNCTARLAQPGSLACSEEQRVRLLIAVLDEVRRQDSQAPMIVTFDQPWGEYLVDSEGESPPLHLADSMVRAELGIAAVGLELNVGYSQPGSFNREPTEYSRLIDRWSALNIPLLVFLTAPSSSAPDAAARRQCRASEAVASRQVEYVSELVQLLLAKPFVQGLFWNELTDGATHDYPHSGLHDAAGAAKPLLNALIDLRQRLLPPAARAAD